MQSESLLVTKIIKLFHDFNYARHENITDKKLQDILNQRSYYEMGKPFKKQLFHQLLNSCIQQNYGEVSANSFSAVVKRAHNILQQRIRLLESEDGFINDRIKLIEKKQKEQQSIGNRSPSKSLKMQMQGIEDQINNIKNEIQAFKNDLAIFKNQKFIIEAVFLDYVSKKPQKIVKNTKIELISISLAAYTALVCLFLQFVLLLPIRPSFMAIIYYLHVLYLLFIGYFHRKSGMFIILQGIITIICDLSYFILKSFYNQIYHPHRLINPIYRYFESNITVLVSEIILVLSIIARILIIIWMFKLRYLDIEQKIKYDDEQRVKMERQISYGRDIRHIVGEDTNTNDVNIDNSLKYVSSNRTAHNDRKFNFFGKLYYINGKVRVKKQKFALC